MDWRRIFFPTKRSLERWEHERAKGIFRFVLLKGALCFGLLMYVAMSAAFYVTGWGAVPITLRGRFSPIEAFVGLLLVGVIWGVLTWFACEAPYASHRRKAIRF
jgi:hypothetical protein